MSLHVRHIASEATPRVQIKFVRKDLLYRHHTTLIAPDGRRSVPRLPLPIDRGGDGNYQVGPTILDVIVGDAVVVTDDDGKTIGAWRWRMRDLATIWSEPEPLKLASPAKPSKKKTKQTVRPAEKAHGTPDHPFKPSLASGGRFIDSDADFVHVEKLSTITINAYALRLTAGIKGDVHAAYVYIRELAADAWSRDLERARTLFEKIRAAGPEGLIETAAVATLRPDSSISQEIEARLMHDACKWFGVDPALDCRLPPGRPRTSGASDEGEVIAVYIDAQNQLTAKCKRDYHGIAAGTDLATLPLIKLIELLGGLRLDQHDHDCDLLEAYLDRAAPDWRDHASTDAAAGQAAASVDAYEVLGVERTATTEDVRRAWKRTMQQVHPDKGIGRVFAQMAADAYRKIMTERGEA